MTFQIGEKVVYPNHGIGIIENISIRNFGAQNERFYLLKLDYKSMVVMVPFSHVQDVGLRKVTRHAEIARVLTFLSEGMCSCKADWKDRFKDNCEKMKSGSLLEVAEVFKMLLILQKHKPLSFREKKMLDKARHLLITEVSIAQSVHESQAMLLLETELAKASLSFPAAI
ncbi:MAG TPA: CarD family transcriptional regulator [Bryobacteraceae bacterium]|nr:CarD family transcriptional regulator [Bryobacteraceae bacterium]